MRFKAVKDNFYIVEEKGVLYIYRNAEEIAEIYEMDACYLDNKIKKDIPVQKLDKMGVKVYTLEKWLRLQGYKLIKEVEQC